MEITLSWLSIVLPALVTVVGLWVSFHLTKRNLIDEISKKKTDIYLDKLADMPLAISNLVDKIQANDSGQADEFKTILSKTLAYGTKDAMKVAVEMQQTNFYLSDHPNETENNNPIHYLVILVCQLKYDLTGIETNASYWYKMKMKDYDKVIGKYGSSNNKIVKELELKDFLLINEQVQ